MGRRIAVTFLAVLVVGCGGGAATPTPAWPVAYETGMCGALAEFDGLTDGGRQLQDRFAARDLAGIEETAEAMRGIMDRVQASLATVPAWAPGDRLTEATKAWAVKQSDALGDLVSGVRLVDADLVTSSTTKITEATALMRKAIDLIDPLKEATGFTC